MSQIGWEWGGKQYTFEEALSAAANRDAPVPVEFLNALRGDHEYNLAPSASVVGGCLRRFNLERDHDFYSTVENQLAAFFGTAVHLLLQRAARPGVIAEERLRWELEFPDLPEPYNRLVFAGTPDIIDETTATVRDYKSKVSLLQSTFPTEQHIRQVNVLNWLYWKNTGKSLRHWEILYFDQKAQPKLFRGTLADPEAVGVWLEQRLYEWARVTSEGRLPHPIPQFFEEDKYGDPVSPCKYCAVREHCLAAWRAEHGELPDDYSTGGVDSD